MSREKQTELLINASKSNNSEVISNKQIEEMAFNLIMATSPLGVKDLTKQFDYNTVAKDLYELYGWRKQSEGEWRSELVKKCDWKGKKHDYYQPNSCSLCHEAVVKRTPYCPNCGAKMKGGEHG